MKTLSGTGCGHPRDRFPLQHGGAVLSDCPSTQTAQAVQSEGHGKAQEAAERWEQDTVTVRAPGGQRVRKGSQIPCQEL